MIDRSRRLSYENAGYISGKMVNDLSPRKTMLVLVIVVGCFAVLWPKVFYPMLVGSANTRIKPSSIDRTQGCCDVIYERDVTTIKLMSEICKTIAKNNEENSLLNKDLIQKCQNIVLDTCGIDISAVLQGQVRLGHTTKQILEEIRSLNGSLCLKYNFGVAPWMLGVPHRVTVKMLPSSSIRQERPLHLRSEMVHPAFRERGRAIPQTEFTPTKPAPPSRLIKKVVEGKPGPIPGMRPTIGGAGHIVPPSKQGGNSMGLIMPLYTIGIVVFFAYTVMKIVFKKQSDALYQPINPDPHFRREVFEADRRHSESKVSKDSVSSKLVVNAMSALLDEVDLELSSRHQSSEDKQEDVVANCSLANQADDQSSVQVLGLETSASRENGQKWTSSTSPIFPVAHPHPRDIPPQEIFLEGCLPPQSHLIVTDSATETQKLGAEEDPAIVLAGKMTLSVISIDSSENGTEETSISEKKPEDRSSSNVSEEFEKIDIALLDEEINDIIAQAEHVNTEVLKNIHTLSIKEIDNIKESIASESVACIMQTAENDHKPVLIKNETNVDIVVESKPPHKENTILIENIIEENVGAVVETIQDKQKELNGPLFKTEQDLAKTIDIVDSKMNQIQKDLVHIENEQNAKDCVRNEVTEVVKQSVDDIREELLPVTEEIVNEEMMKNKIGLSSEIKEVESKYLEQITAEIEGPKIKANITGQIKQKDSIKEENEIQTIIDTIKEDIVKEELIISNDEKELNENLELLTTTEETIVADEISLEKSTVQEDIKVEDKKVLKAPSMIGTGRATDDKDLVSISEPIKFEEYVLEGDNEQEDNGLNKEDIVISQFAEAALLGDINSTNNREDVVEEEYQEDSEGEYEEEVDIDDENGEEFEQEIIEYISDEEVEGEEEEDLDKIEESIFKSHA